MAAPQVVGYQNTSAAEDQFRCRILHRGKRCPDIMLVVLSVQAHGKVLPELLWGSTKEQNLAGTEEISHSELWALQWLVFFLFKHKFKPSQRQCWINANNICRRLGNLGCIEWAWGRTTSFSTAPKLPLPQMNPVFPPHITHAWVPAGSIATGAAVQ